MINVDVNVSYVICSHIYIERLTVISIKQLLYLQSQKMQSQTLICLAFLLGLFALASADTPANCTYEDIRGYWIFQETDRIETRQENCDKFPATTNNVYIKLDFPNIATDNVGNVGTWTLIYNQGFEVIINYRKYFAFSLYKQSGSKVTSYCNLTSPGWSHDLLGNNWACIKGKKVSSWKGQNFDETFIGLGKTDTLNQFLLEAVDMNELLSENFVRKINTKQSSWSAKVYSHLQHLGAEELIGMAGGRASRLAQ